MTHNKMPWLLGVLIVGLMVVGPVAYSIVPRETHTVAVVLPQPKDETDWPLFRGDPLQTGVAKTTLPDKLEIRWKIDLKKGIESTAAIVKDTIYVGCYDDHLHAIDLATGNTKWKAKIGATKAPPSVYQGKVFVGTEDASFFCLDAATGNKIWEYEVNGEITGGANFDGDNVIFGAHDSTLYCLAIKDKTLRWKIKIDGPVNGSAVIANKQTFLAGCDSHLHIIDIKDGKEKTKIELSGQAAATAAVLNDKLFVGNMNGVLQSLDLKKEEVLWSFEPKRSQPFYGSAAVTDKYVVVGSRDRSVYALPRDKGEKPVWSFPTDGPVDCSPVIAGNRVYFGAGGGTFYVVNLDTGKEVLSITLGGRITASPAVARGCIVIGNTDGLLYCLGKKD
ncbi:MAG: PQQ-binding-like beta-propeller repeat protein [Planctomycetes bacterium]|nr:PQQ-binding-like beta-propeller repeat protein [Planctomycetota bacterium]